MLRQIFHVSLAIFAIFVGWHSGGVLVAKLATPTPAPAPVASGTVTTQ